MAKQNGPDYAEILALISRLKLSIQDNPEAQKLIRKLEKQCAKLLSNPQVASSEKSRDTYKIVTVLLQLERVAEDHWEEIKELFR